MRKLVWFIAAGSAGFLVDAGSLTLLVQWTSLGPFIARILSIALAVTTTWLINRHLTFEKSPHSTAVEATRYGSVAFITALINYGLFSGMILIWPALWPAIAAGMATIVTMFLSFFGYSKLVFGSKAKE
jgi:putative flippase GtrA